MAKVLEGLEDCGGEGHLWEAVGQIRDPASGDNVSQGALIQRG
jgi:hypothetical protein